MKAQYFGDKHDFFKYRLLSRLGSAGFRVGHFWMLTPADGRSDGNHDIPHRDTVYLQPDEARLLEFLQTHRKDRDHGFKQFQTSGLLPGVTFFDDTMPARGGPERNALIQRCSSFFSNEDVISFDPDNGLEVPTVPYNRLRSDKYVYVNELKFFVDSGKSLMIYQHKPMHQKLNKVEDSKRRLLEKFFPQQNIFFINHTRVFFIFVIQPHHNAINIKLFESLVAETTNKSLTTDDTAYNIRCPHCDKIIKLSISADIS